MKIKTLFELSVLETIKYPQDLGKAAFLLPQKISHYLLYLSCCSGNYGAVTNLVQHWPQTELSFNFFSNPLCRLSKENEGGHCLAPYQYFNLCSEDFDTCIPSISLGLFQNFHRRSRIESTTKGLEHIDLSSIRVTTESNVEHLLKLAQGEFPIKHPADYLTDKDAKVYGQAKLRLYPPQGSNRPKLYVTIAISSSKILDRVINLCSVNSFFDLDLSGCDLILMPKKKIPYALRSLNIISSCVRDLFMHLHDLLELPTKDLPSLPLSPATCLWLITNHYSRFEDSLPFTKYTQVLSQLIVASPTLRGVFLNNSTSDDAVLVNSLLGTEELSMSAFSLLRSGFGVSDLTAETKQLLPKLVGKSCLEYFQIRSGYLTMLPACIDSLQLSSSLRVLSVTQFTNLSINNRIQYARSPACIFSAIAHISTLEYFEWYEAIVLRTSDILVLNQSLSDSLHHLQHCHLRKFQMLVSTVDLASTDYGPIMDLLQTLLFGKEGDESISTYKFSLRNDKVRKYLFSLRPDVCFNFAGLKPVEHGTFF